MLRISDRRGSSTLKVVGEARVIKIGALALMNLKAISLEMRPVEQIIFLGVLPEAAEIVLIRSSFS